MFLVEIKKKKKIPGLLQNIAHAKGADPGQTDSEQHLDYLSLYSLPFYQYF